MALNRKLTDLTEKLTVPDESWIHVVDPTDISQSPEGSSYKVKKQNFGGLSDAPSNLNTYGRKGGNWEIVPETDISGKEDISNKSDSYTSSSSTTYGSTKALVDGLAIKQSVLVSTTNIKTVDGITILGSGDLVTKKITTRKTITTANLSTQDVAGFLTYVNGVSSFAISYNETVIYEVTDTTQTFLIYKNNTTVGSGQPALISSDILEIRPKGGGRCVWAYPIPLISGVSLTGTTSETIVKIIELPKVFLDNGFVEIEFNGARVVTTAAATTINMYINSSGVLVGSVASTTMTAAASTLARGLPMRRSIAFNATDFNLLNNLGATDDTSVANNVRILTINASIKTNNFLIFTYTNGATDTTATPMRINVKIFN